MPTHYLHPHTQQPIPRMISSLSILLNREATSPGSLHTNYNGTHLPDDALSLPEDQKQTASLMSKTSRSALNNVCPKATALRPTAKVFHPIPPYNKPRLLGKPTHSVLPDGSTPFPFAPNE